MTGDLVLKGYSGHKRTTTPRRTASFAKWAAQNAAACVLPLKLNADVVAWIVAVLQSSGEMDGIENVITLARVLKHRRTTLRFPTDREWETVMLPARVLLRTWEMATGRS
jgi:hypothetical protein